MPYQQTSFPSSSTAQAPSETSHITVYARGSAAAAASTKRLPASLEGLPMRAASITSTMRPSESTATLSQSLATALRSCEMKSQPA